MRCLMLLLSLALAQTWAPVGTRWQYKVIVKEYDVWGYITCVRQVWELKVVKDTFFQGQLCRLIRFYTPKDSSDFFVYEQNKRVYYYDTSYQGFLLLYDFNTTAGAYWVRGVNDTVWVDWVDTIQWQGVPFKRFFIHKQEPIYQTFGNPILEKIGSWTFLFPKTEILDLCGMEVIFKGMQCFEQGSLKLGNCIMMSRAKPKEERIEIVLYPNPATSILSLLWEDERVDKVEVIIYDALGKVVNRWSSVKQGEQILLLSLAKGMYFIAVFSPFWHWYGKFIKE